MGKKLPKKESKNSKRKLNKALSKAMTGILTDLGIPSNIMDTLTDDSYSSSLIKQFNEKRERTKVFKPFEVWLKEYMLWEKTQPPAESYIRKFKDEEESDTYHEEDGCYWDSGVSFLQGAFFNFCCCGCPEDNLLYIRNGLRFIQYNFETIGNYDLKEKEAIKVFGSTQARNFFCYWTEEAELTEHGSIIPGWISDKGKQILFDLENILKEEING